MPSFWNKKPLSELTPDQWESLCDRCAWCCVHKLEDEETGELFYTNVACNKLDPKTCECNCYQDRYRQVPDCLSLTPDNITQYAWLPTSCAYRLLKEEKNLPRWHHLVTGLTDSIHDSRISAQGRVIRESEIDDLAEYVITPPFAVDGHNSFEPEN